MKKNRKKTKDGNWKGEKGIGNRIQIERMIKDSKAKKPNITTEKCKSCSDVVLRLCDVYSEIKV